MPVKTNFDIPQLFLRLVLGIGFLLPVMDRFGWLGAAAEHGNAWGNWKNFVDYTQLLMPYLSHSLAEIMGALATLGEVVFGIALIIGFKTRLAALGSFLLTLIFGLSMAVFLGPRIPFNYSVYADSAAALLLACLPAYRWSVSK